MDRAEALALSLYRAGLCPLCGRPTDVCTADENKGAPPFFATFTACRATAAKLELERALTEGGKKSLPDFPAYLFSAQIRR